MIEPRRTLRRQRRARSELHTWGASPANGGVFIQIQRSASVEDRAAIEQFAEAAKVPVSVETVYLESNMQDDSRDDDNSPYSGGAAYQRRHGDGTYDGGLKGCSTGFGYRAGGRDYILTAGHCFPRNGTHNYMYFPVLDQAGKVSNSTWRQADGDGTMRAGVDNAFHGDLSLVAVGANGKAAAHNIWWGTTTTTNRIPVTLRRVPAGGMDICINGKTSGSDCGLTTSLTNINHEYDDGTVVRNGDRGYATNTHDCSRPGDSGGSIVKDHSGAETQATAVGIVSGHSTNGLGDCFQFFTGIEEANQAWEGNIKFA